MSTLIECQELIDVVLGAIAKCKGGTSGASHSFHQQQDCELYDGLGNVLLLVGHFSRIRANPWFQNLKRR